MIYLVFGEDKYRLNKYLAKLRIKHNSDGQNLNVHVVGGSKSFNDLENTIMASPFLADSKIVIIENLIKLSNADQKEKLISLLDKIPSNTDLVIKEDQKPDQRLAIVKHLNKIAQVQNFELLKQNEIVLWIEETVKNVGGTITKPDAFMLFQRIGSDLQDLENEIIKLTTYNKNISKENIEKLVEPGFFNSIFELMDQISNKNTKEAQKIMLKTLESEEGNELYILSMLSRQVRNLQIIKDLSNHKLSELEITNKTKLHPFVVKKTLVQTRNFSAPELIYYQKLILEAETQIKTTGTDPTLLILKLTNELSSKK